MTRLLPSTVLALALVATGAAPTTTEPIEVPEGGHVLLDGRIGAGEWTDAREVRLSSSVGLLVKRDATYLYLAVVPKAPVMFGVDLYFDTGAGDPVLNLHGSAKLGERRGEGERWPEWAWWNNVGWAANVARAESFTERRFLPDEAREFQIALARLGGNEVDLSVDLQSAGVIESAPVEGPERKGRRWVGLRLGSK